MKKYILILLTTFSTLAAMAFVPGFQGKRFTVMYQLGVTHPAITARTGKLPTFFNNLVLDYTLSRKWTIGIKYGFMTYKAPTAKAAFNYNHGSYYSSDGYYKNTSYPGRYMQHIVAVQARKFVGNRGYIAPVGRYIIVGAYYQYATDQLTMVKSGAGVGGLALTGYKTRAHMGGITVGLGRNYVVARRMLLDIGFCINVTPFVMIESGQSVKTAVWSNMFFRNLFQINLGMGALAF